MIDVQVRFETGTFMEYIILVSGYSPGWRGKNEVSNVVEIRIRYFPNRNGLPYHTLSCLVCLSDDSGNMQSEGSENWNRDAVIIEGRDILKTFFIFSMLTLLNNSVILTRRAPLVTNQ